MSDLNPEALEKAQEAVKHMGTRVCTVEAAIRTYLASLPPVDAGDLVEVLQEFDARVGSPLAREIAAAISALQGERDDHMFGRLKAEAEVALIKAELAEGCDLLDRFDGHLPTVRRYLERVRSFRDGQKTGEATAICKSCGQSFPLSAPHDCPGLTAGSQKGNSE